MKKTFLGFIGGTGLYDLPDLKNLQEIKVETPFGMPSDRVIVGDLSGVQVAFLPRHGRGHTLLPSEVNYRANIYALKKIGVTHIVSVNSVGSLQAAYPPGSAVIPSQVFDRAIGNRQKTFFGNGVVGHMSFADPFCSEIRHHLKESCEQNEIQMHAEGTYVCIEGPRFSTRAECFGYKKEGADIVGMTAMPEAILAREAEIPYAILAFVTDYDCWREETEAVSVDLVLSTLKKNNESAKRAVISFINKFPKETNNPLFQAAQHAILTREDLIPAETKSSLSLLYGKYWKSL